MYLGDFDITETMLVPFETYEGAGGSVTITGFAVTDIEVMKGISITPRASDNGYALIDTDGVDVGGRVGIHGFSIDLSDNSDAGFYADGSRYRVVVDAITVDGQTVRFSHTFSIGCVLRPTTAGRKLDVSASGNAGIDFGNVENPTATVGLTNTTVGTVTTLAGHTPQTGDSFGRIGVAGVGLTNVPWNALWDGEVQSEVADALLVYDAPTQTEMIASFAALNDPTAAAIRAEIDLNSTQFIAIKSKTDQFIFVAGDVKATLDGEAVVTDAASRTASQANVVGMALETSVQAVPTTAEIDAALVAGHGAGSWQSGAGGGGSNINVELKSMTVNQGGS